jgi:hypothetical protein
MRQLEVKIPALVGNVRAVLGVSTTRPLAPLRPFHFVRHLAVQAFGGANRLGEKLGIAVASACIVGEKALQTEIETAALTRAGSFDLKVLNDAENQPQPADAVALDREGFDLPQTRTMLDKPIVHTVDPDCASCPCPLPVGLCLVLVPLDDFVSRLWEGEGFVLLRLLELRATFRQPVEEPLIGIVYATTYLLTDLRMQIAPQGEPLGFPQFQDVAVHPVQRDGLPGESVVATLQGNEVIPRRRGDKEFVSQLPVLLIDAVQTVFIHLADGDRITHAPIPKLSESWWA